MPELQPSPEQLLNEKLSDRLLTQERHIGKFQWLIDLALVAVPAVLTAGAAGNVTCKIAARQILTILQRK